MSSEKQISVSITVPFTRQLIFSVLANPEVHTSFDGSGTVKDLVSGSILTDIGDVFKVKMQMWGFSYKIKNTVVEYEQDSLIAWSHMGKHRWRYKLSDTDTGTLITETFDWSYSVFPWLIELAGYPRSHPEQMKETLKRLVDYLEKL